MSRTSGKNFRGKNFRARTSGTEHNIMDHVENFRHRAQQPLPFSTEHFVRHGSRQNRSSQEDQTVSTTHDDIVDWRSQHIRLGSAGHTFMVAAFAAKQHFNADGEKVGREQGPSEIKMTVSEVTSGDGIWKLVIEGDSLDSIFDLYSSIAPSQEESNLQLGPILDWFIRQVRIDERNGHNHFYLAGLNYRFSLGAPQSHNGHNQFSASAPQSQQRSSRTPQRTSLHEEISQSQQLSSRMPAVDSSPFTNGIMGLSMCLRKTFSMHSLSPPSPSSRRAPRFATKPKHTVCEGI
jgi:hypothetical protein